MSNGRTEKAISILETASGLHSIEDARELIDKAIYHLRDEPELVPALQLSRDMIYEAIDRLAGNMPKHEDSASERSSKIHICESALLQIVEYAKAGLAARRLGSQEVAEKILRDKAQKSMVEFDDAAIEISVNGGSTVKTTMAGFERAAKLAEDPAMVRRILDEGE
jgi:predicted nucleic-acid-binding protein